MRSGEIIGGRFELERRASAGGMGTIFRARDRLTGEAVAFKVMSGQSHEHAVRFEREALALARVSHPAVVGYVDHGVTEAGECWVVMEWLEGESLAARLSRQELSLGEALLLARRLAEGLAATHAAGIVHRDVKPANVLLGAKRVDQAKLLDLGLARLTDDLRDVTQNGTMIGTPGYAAPEQVRAANRVDARADVFALGCVLFRCLTGRAPFQGKGAVAVLVKTMLEDAPRVSEIRGVPERLDQLVARMLAKAPEGRPADGAAVFAELQAIGDVATVSASPKSARAAALTETEQRVLCVILARPWEAPPGASPAAAAPFGSVNERTAVQDAVRAAIARHGGRAEFLIEGSLVVTLSDAREATDQATRAARCVLAARALLPAAPMALATGSGRLSERWPAGEVVDRAVRLLEAPFEAGVPRPVRIDDVTAGLLGGRFELGRDAGGSTLESEGEALDPARTLLGKPTPCVGRDRELSSLEATFRECAEEPVARVVVIIAPAGAGKSRLCHELLSKLERGGAPLEVLVGRGDALSAGSAFGILAPAIRRAAGVLEGEPLELRRQKLGARVARHMGSASDARRVTEFLGELIGTPFPDDENVQLRAARGDALLMGDQMKRAWEDWLTAECAAHPVLLILEDLQWGDRPSVAFVDAALRKLHEAPLMVLALARPEMRELFPRLWATRQATEMSLASLGRKASHDLVRATLGESATAEVTARICERAAGNAFYLEELIRAVAEGRGDRLPDTLLAVAQARLERLDADARRILRAASVFGQTFCKGAVAALLGGEAPELAKGLASLAALEVVTARAERKLSGEEEYTFRHALVRDAAYAMLTPADRTLGHRLAGDWLERCGDTEAAVLAEHFERGGEPARAVGWYRRAAEQALEGHDFAAVLERSEGGLRCGATGEPLGALRLLQAEAHKWRGQSEDAEACALEAMRRLFRGSALWYAAAGEAALACGTLGRLERLADIAGELKAAITRGPMEAPAVVAVERAVIQLLARGRYPLAEELQRPIDAGASAIAARDPTVRARILQAHAERALVDGDAGGHLRLREACAQGFDDAGDARNACHACVNLGYAYLEIGAHAEAERFLREALATADKMGLPPVRAIALHNLGLALARRGEITEALAMESAAVDAAAAQGDRRVEGSSRLYVAAILALTPDLERAEREARSAMDQLSDSVPGRTYAAAMLGRVLLERGRAPEALVAAGEAMSVLESLGGIEEGESLIRLVHAEALHATGDLAGARAAIEIARQRLEERAAKIREPPWRASFLEQIPENARTMQLAAEWLA